SIWITSGTGRWRSTFRYYSKRRSRCFPAEARIRVAMVVQHSPVPAKQDVLGVGISATSYNEVTAACAQWIAQRDMNPQSPARYVCVTSVHGVMEARKDSTIREILNGADIATPDGMPLVWALRSFGETRQERVYGPNLMLM